MSESIKETLEMAAYVSAIVTGLEQAKANDGKIDKAEVMAVAMATIPDAIKAGLGSWNIPAELRNLDEAEKEQLLAVCIPIMLRVAGLFSSQKSP